MREKLIEILKLPTDATEEQIIASVAALNAEAITLRPLQMTDREKEIRSIMAAGHMTRDNALIVIASREAAAQVRKPAAKTARNI